ncbi:SCO-spondin-like, partial [Actinia tenebrosa]|uniref:SCO-spondin-like n=1 Tax=Actinia tenebrosa TaxID=6105 RepID=A0A6P8HXB9_ACTTE
MAKFDMILRVIFSTVFVLVLLSSIWKGGDAEANITFYAKERGKALKGIIKQLITDYKKLGLANGKISNELAALGGLQNLPANNGMSPPLQGFVSPSNDGSKQPVPSDQSSIGMSVVQNFTAAQGTIPMDGGFTQWTEWSKCPVSCGRTALRSRERYCTNPAPANGGKNCEGPRFQLKLCKMKECPTEGRYTEWSAWSKCSNKCGTGIKHRYRYCTNPAPGNGGSRCSGKRKQVAKCHGKMCNDQNSVVDIDPQTVCGYDPCSVAKCITMPYATCVSDFKCKPVFFDSEEKRVDSCKGTELYLTINPDSVCRFNPCKYTTCMTSTPAKCVVDTKCQPVFLNAFGKRMSCKGIVKT